MNLPNSLTLFRIILIPVLVVMIYIPTTSSNFAAAIVFFIAAVTDWLDGFLARRYQQVTSLGSFLDPVADKIVTVTALVILVERHPHIWMTLPAVIIICREILVSALREWMAGLGEKSKVAVSWLGKVKTTAQLSSLFLLIWDYNFYVHITGLVLLYIAIVLTVWSMVQYLYIAKDSFFV